jgi:hypothetical protein
MEPTITHLKLRLISLDPTAARKAVTYSVGSYNTRRYGRPWIANIAALDIGKFPVLVFGASSINNAETGAAIGDIVKAGQKDHRKPTYSDNDFYIVDDNYKLERITENQAKVLYRSTAEEILAKIDSIAASEQQATIN